MDGAGRGTWVSRRVGKGAFQALSMERRSDEGHRDLRYWLVLHSGTGRRWWMEGSSVG